MRREYPAPPQFYATGGIVAVPTETVYGLAARADDAAAVAKIYAAKGRPGFNPLIVHVADMAQARRLGVFSPLAERLAQAGWPGALTLVLPRRTDADGGDVAAAVTAGLPTIALRISAHPVLARLIAKVGAPLAAPSANISEGVSPTTAEHVSASLGDRIDLVLDGGPCETGLESTIVAVRDDGALVILRPGPIDPHALIGATKPETSDDEPHSIEAPGQMPRHYSPGKPVRLNAATARDDEFHVGFGAVAGHINLSATGDLQEAAAALYAALHDAAAAPQLRIAIAPIPQTGIGIAINDRLQRAAA